MRQIAIFSLLTTMGCSTSESDELSSSPPEDGAPLPSAEPEAPPSDSGVEDVASPEFQAHALTFTVDEAGEVELDGATWTWSLADVLGEELCSQELELISAIPAEIDEDEPEILAAWILGVQPSEAPPCGENAPVEAFVGIELPDARLVSLMAGDAAIAGLDLYSYTIRFEPSGSRILHGVATTPELLQGDSAPVEVGPLPAASYSLQPLIYLDLDLR
ncbi:MAG: hypothetical protein AAF211_26805 [Myxococcota bacterium]